MKAVEFEAELSDDTILIPEDFRLELSLSKDKHVRVIVLIDDVEKDEKDEFKVLARTQFFEGYAKEDLVYDCM